MELAWHQLRHFQPEGWPVDIVSAGFIQQVTLAAGVLNISLRWPLAADDWQRQLQAALEPGLLALPGVTAVNWQVRQDVATLARATQVAAIPGVRNVIVVASAKGGVGKSTVAVNLALALSLQGARVGLLDADIYGPSVPLMLGSQNERPDSPDGKHMLPIKVCGLATLSIGYLVPAAESVVWRGPMASKALGQLLHETLWGELDYLIVDMPPGTGDLQLTMAQQIPTTTVIMVTTPQDVALIDVRKGISMLDKIHIPVLGVVENMSVHVCSHCGHEESLFGCGGGEALAQEFNIPLLATLPLHIAIRQSMDAGSPIVAAMPDSPIAERYRSLAKQVAARLYFSGKTIPATIFTAPA